MVGLVAAACAGEPSATRVSAPTQEKPRLGEPCAIQPTQASKSAAPHVLLEVALATFDAKGPAFAPSAPAARWIDDPRVAVLGSTLVLTDLNEKSRIVWSPKTAKEAHMELRVTPQVDPKSGQVPIEVDMFTKGGGLAKDSKPDAHTTVVVAAQQTVILAAPGMTGSVFALTPYVVRGDEEQAQLRSCKPGMWLDGRGQSSVTSPVVPAQSAAAPKSSLDYSRFEMSGTLVRELPSELTGKTHSLIISVPPSFQQEPLRRYPVLFLLDGQWDFPLVNSISGKLFYDRVLPEMLIVGLSYAGEQPNYDQLRTEDYVPTRAKARDGIEKGGGAPRFLSWIETAVIPLMEQEYRADPARRVLAGSSHGGLFTLYALFEKPELFWGYISASPSVGWDDREMFRREKAFRATHSELQGRLWLSSGSEERPDYVANEVAFFKQLAASRYRGLTLKVHSVAGGRHAGSAAEAYTRALRFIAEPLLPL